MANKDVSKIKLPNSDVLALKDAEARAALESLLHDMIIIDCGDATRAINANNNTQGT